MKRYIYILICMAAVLAAASCTKSDFEDDYSVDVASRAITYSSRVEATRAVPTTDASISEFHVATFLADAATTPYYNDDVAKDDSGVWTSGTPRYWSPYYPLNIYAYSPLTDFITINESEDFDAYSLTYTCPSEVDDQVDLLGEKLVKQSWSEDGVGLLFDHLLSCIKFNVEIESEKNVVLDRIEVTYRNIVKQRTYSFATESWGDLGETYFDEDDGLTTSIDVNTPKLLADGATSVEFNDIEDCVMIIPQPIDNSSKTGHYLSIQLFYTLKAVLGDTGTVVETGIMPLPAPLVSSVRQNEYKKGEVYTYNIKVNGKSIRFDNITIEDQTPPEASYGNICLGLINDTKTAAEIGYTGTTETDATAYYAVAERVKTLMDDGVRDFVVIGSLGVTGESAGTLGNGKLGFYGSTSSPFYIGAVMENLAADDYFSVDLRGTYDYPDFTHGNDDTDDEFSGGATVSDNILGGDKPILIAGLFAHINWLDEVMLPNGVAAIGNHGFAACGGLRTIDLANVEHIEIGAFQHCEVLKTVKNGKITRVHDNGFDHCHSLEWLDLSLVTEIDNYGFSECHVLSNVNLSLLDEIGKYAFFNCPKLTIEKGKSPSFTTVEDFAFSGCIALGSNDEPIDLSQTTRVGAHAFGATYNTSGCEQMELLTGNLNNLEVVGVYAFDGCDALGSGQEVSLPNIDSIYAGGFANCPALNIVNGLGNLTAISDYSFQNCTSLTGYSATANPKLLSLPDVQLVGDFGFSGSAITSVEFSDDLTSIGEHAFNGCASLTSLTKMDKVTSVGHYAFANCTSLESLSLPLLTSENCGGDFFSNCPSLKVISLPGLTDDVKEWTDDAGVKQKSVITEEIGNNIEEIHLPLLQTVIKSWGSGFQNCSNLRIANFGAATEVQAGAFADCSSLRILNLSSATILGDYVLQGCTALEELYLSALGGTYGGYHFFCETEDYVNYDDNLTLRYVDLSNIGELAGGTFMKCKKLEEVKLGTATIIGESAFKDCVSLQEFSSTNVETIGGDAFRGCVALEELIIPNAEGTFGGWQYFYQGATPNENLLYADLASVDVIGGATFLGCTNLVAVDLRSATIVNNMLFQDCQKLERVNLSSLVAGTYIDGDGNTVDKIAGGLLWNVDSNVIAGCEIWLSHEQAEIAYASGDGKTWSGMSWAAVHDVTDPAAPAFSLK